MTQPLTALDILIKDAKLTSEKLNENSAEINAFIKETKQKQIDILKLKEVSQDRLRMVIQL
jgi:hypothetical protein